MRNLTILAATLAILFGAGLVLAQATTSPAEAGSPPVTFPIPELGDCASKTACKTYCDDNAHVDSCFMFAETHGLMSTGETKQARAFLKLKGPGGCAGIACKTYCNDIGHFEECRVFAEQSNWKKDVATSTPAKTEKPIGCTNREECEMLCKINLSAWGLVNKGAPPLSSPAAPKSPQKPPSMPPATQTLGHSTQPPPSLSVSTSSTISHPPLPTYTIPVSPSSTTSHPPLPTYTTPPSSMEPPPLPTSMNRPTNYLAAAVYSILQFFGQN